MQGEAGIRWSCNSTRVVDERYAGRRLEIFRAPPEDVHEPTLAVCVVSRDQQFEGVFSLERGEAGTCLRGHLRTGRGRSFTFEQDFFRGDWRELRAFIHRVLDSGQDFPAELRVIEEVDRPRFLGDA